MTTWRRDEDAPDVCIIDDPTHKGEWVSARAWCNADGCYGSWVTVRPITSHPTELDCPLCDEYGFVEDEGETLQRATERSVRAVHWPSSPQCPGTGIGAAREGDELKAEMNSSSAMQWIDQVRRLKAERVVLDAELAKLRKVREAAAAYIATKRGVMHEHFQTGYKVAWDALARALKEAE